MTDQVENLSPAGVERREAILRETLRAVRLRRRRRQTLKLTTGLAILALAVLLARHPFGPAGVTSPRGNRTEVTEAGEVGAAPEPGPVAVGPVVQIIPPDAAICTRLAAPACPPTWRTIDDDHLLAALAEVGQRAGLVRINGKAMLLAAQ